MPVPVKIKICGVRTPQIAEAAADAGADFIGLMFVRASPRFVTEDQAAAIIDHLAGRAQPIGVFKDQTPDYIHQVATRLGLWGVQLHGRWTDEHIARLAPKPVIGAVPFDPDSLA